MKQLGRRLASSAVLVSLTIWTVFFAPLLVFFLIVELLIVLALSEYFDLAARKGIQVARFLCLLTGSLVPVFFLFGAESMALIAASLAVFLFNFKPDQRHQALVTTAVTAFGILYVSWFLSHLIMIRGLEYGSGWVFYTLLIVKGGDAGAYFVGNRMGRNKLIEHVSPNKSVEGAVGGFVTTIVLSLLSRAYLPNAQLFHLLVLGAAVGVVSQLGDLAESLMKRDAGVKDSGQIPGLGGLLDVLDSLLLTVPFVYYYITAVAGIPSEIFS